MLICFTLSMPNIGSWNGEWSGEGNLYAIVKNMGRKKAVEEKAKEILEKKYYNFDFEDGWTARIDVRKVTAKEAVKIRRESKGFCNYNWMIDSIIDNGKIVDVPTAIKDYFEKMKKEIDFPIGTVIVAQSWSVFRDLKNFCGFPVMLTNVPSEREFFFGFPYRTSQETIKSVVDYLEENLSSALEIDRVKFAKKCKTMINY